MATYPNFQLCHSYYQVVVDEHNVSKQSAR